MKSEIVWVVALTLGVMLVVTTRGQSPTGAGGGLDKGGGGGGGGAITAETTQVGVVDGIDGPFLVLAWYDREGFLEAMDTGRGITDAIVRQTRHVPLASIVSVERPGQPDPAEVRGSVYYVGPFGDIEEALIVDLLARQNNAGFDDDLASLILDRWSLWLTEGGR